MPIEPWDMPESRNGLHTFPMKRVALKFYRPFILVMWRMKWKCGEFKPTEEISIVNARNIIVSSWISINIVKRKKPWKKNNSRNVQHAERTGSASGSI